MTSSTDETVRVVNVPDFWSRLRSSHSRFLALDYDGTLAPFHVDPMKAFPLPGSPELIKTLSERNDTTVAIISGRPVEEVRELLGDLGIILVGSHGREIRQSNGRVTVMKPSAKQEQGLEAALEAAIQEGLEHHLERKIASLALHTRVLTPDKAAAIENHIFEKWTPLARDHNLECMRFNGGVEIRSVGRHKGDILKELLELQPEGTFSVYIGDDLTDEDAFKAIKERGIGIKVGEATTSTAASGFLADCEEVKAFLMAWSSIT